MFNRTFTVTLSTLVFAVLCAAQSHAQAIVRYAPAVPHTVNYVGPYTANYVGTPYGTPYYAPAPIATVAPAAPTVVSRVPVPAYSPVVTAVPALPYTAYRPAPVVYARPVPRPLVAAYPPTHTMMPVAPAPVVAAPVAVAPAASVVAGPVVAAPVVVARPVVVAAPRYYVPGQPVRNVLRAIVP